MTVQLVPSLCDTPWRIEDTCRSHQAYPTRRMAERIAELHPLRVLACPKCNDGRRMEPFMCVGSKPTHWHTGHGRSWEGEENTMASAPTAPAPIRAGDTWVAVSAKGRGQPVRIRTVTALNVQFRATGRGADDSKTFSLPVDLFRVRYAPQRSAEDRRRELAQAARRNEPPKADGREIARQAVEVVDKIERELTPAPAPQPAPEPAAFDWESLRPSGRHGKVAKLTALQAREICQLYLDGGSPAEIARTYAISEPTVINIGKGRNYEWATGDLRAGHPEATPRRRHGGAPKLNAEQAREIAVLIRKGVPDPEIAAAYGDLNPSTISAIRRGKIWEKVTADILNPQPSPGETPQQEEPVQITIPPTVIDTKTATSDVDRAVQAALVKTWGDPVPSLVTDLADALEMLLDVQAGKPLPRFVTLDLSAIRQLIEQARA